MGTIRRAYDLAAVRKTWLAVFASNDPFSWPFRDDLVASRAFFPTEGYHLTRPQYSALTAALQRLGEATFRLSIVESEGLAFLDRDWGHWECELPSYEEYSELPLTLETSLYSADGKWGILISHEMHALVGGTKRFASLLDEGYPDWAEDLGSLRQAWNGNPRAAWLKPIVARLLEQT